MDQTLVAIGAYALAAFLVRLFMAVEFKRSPPSARGWAALSWKLRAFFWLIVVPSFSAYPVLAFMGGQRVLAALFALFVPWALLQIRWATVAGPQAAA